MISCQGLFLGWGRFPPFFHGDKRMDQQTSLATHDVMFGICLVLVLSWLPRSNSDLSDHHNQLG